MLSTITYDGIEDFLTQHNMSWEQLADKLNMKLNKNQLKFQGVTKKVNAAMTALLAETTPALPVDDAISQREIVQAETQTLKGLAAVADLTSQIERLCDAGLYLVPIPPIDGKATKAPIAKGWNLPRSAINPNGYSNNADDFINCKEDFNFGLCHKPSGTAGIDIDDLNACLPLFETVGLDLSGWLDDPSNVMIESGKPNRAKILFRLPESCDPIITRQYSHNKTMLFELRHSAKTGASVQDIIVGVHPETGTDYRIIGDIGNIQIIPDELLDVALFWDDWKPVFDSVLGVVEPPKEAPRKPLEGENLKGAYSGPT